MVVAKLGFGASRYGLGPKVFNHLISWEIPSLKYCKGRVFKNYLLQPFLLQK